MKKLTRLCLILTFMVAGCNRDVYYDKTKALYEAAEANPNDHTALHTLEKYSASHDPWWRCYAVNSLGGLAFNNVGGCQAELIPYFDKALSDPDYGVKQAGAQAIDDIGNPAVKITLHSLVSIIKQGREDDVTWKCVEALGKCTDKDKMGEAINVLFQAARMTPPEGTPDEAPQIRTIALRSIAAIKKRTNINVDEQLRKLFDESAPSFQDQINGMMKNATNNKTALAIP